MVKKDIAKQPPRKVIKSVQYDLFGKFVSNEPSEISNTIPRWEGIPKYLPPAAVAGCFTEDGLAQPFEHEWMESERDGVNAGRENTCKVIIQPALIKQRDGSYKAFFPSATEELIEEVLKKILNDKDYGFHDPRELETWVKFTRNMVRNELKNRNKTRSNKEVKHSIQVMSKCNIEYFVNGKEVWNGAILQDLVTVGREEYLEDTSTHHMARLPLFISHSINCLAYRQFNYGRLMSCKEQLTRWVYKRMINYYRHANYTNTYHFKYSSLKQSGLLQQKTEGGNRKKVVSSFDELVNKGIVIRYDVEVTEQVGKKIIELVYDIYPSPHFISEQKAANKRAKDHNMLALNTGLSLVDKY